MLPLLVSSEIRLADAYTIAHEPIASIDLMERAAKAFVGWFINHFTDKRQSISVYCGTGNNGGDGLAIARMLKDHSYQQVSVKIASFSSKSSEEFSTNLHRLIPSGVSITEIKPGDELPSEHGSILIDALLGSGLNKPLSGEYERLVNYLNTLERTVVAVDVPTGFFSDGEVPGGAPVLKADLVITFQQPKINFLLPESAPYIDCWEVVGIGISENYIRSSDTPYHLVEERDIRKKLKPRSRFSNKGTYGHALVVAGEAETMGAALLCCSACACSGAGLVTACIPSSGLSALNSYHPEIMAVIRKKGEQPKIEWGRFNSIALGPGLGRDENALALLAAVLKNYDRPMVIDADGLNLLAGNPDLWKQYSLAAVF